MAFDFGNWDGFGDIPKRDLDYLIDTEAINKRLEARKDNPYRVKTGSFTVPKRGISRKAFDDLVWRSSSYFVGAMEKQGWTLESKLKLRGPFLARDLTSKLVMLDKHEFRLEGIFRHRKTPQPFRIEIPPDLVRRDPEQKIDHKQAAKAG